MAEGRSHYTDGLLEEKFMTLTSELRALRDVPVALAKLAEAQEHIAHAQEVNRAECAGAIAKLDEETSERFEALRASTRNTIIAFAAPVVTVLVGGAVTLLLKVAGS